MNSNLISEWQKIVSHKCNGFPGSSACKESAYNAEDPSSIPGLGRSPRKGIGYPFQYSCLNNSRDRGVWQATVHEAGKELDKSEQLSLSITKEYTDADCIMK